MFCSKFVSCIRFCEHWLFYEWPLLRLSAHRSIQRQQSQRPSHFSSLLLRRALLSSLVTSCVLRSASFCWHLWRSYRCAIYRVSYFKIAKYSWFQNELPFGSLCFASLMFESFMHVPKLTSLLRTVAVWRLSISHWRRGFNLLSSLFTSHSSGGSVFWAELELNPD